MWKLTRMKSVSQAMTGNDPGRAGFSPDLRVVRRLSIDPTKVEYRERRNLPVPKTPKAIGIRNLRLLARMPASIACACALVRW